MDVYLGNFAKFRLTNEFLLRKSVKNFMLIYRNDSFRKELSATQKVAPVQTGRQAKHMVARPRAKEFTPMYSGSMKMWEGVRTGEWRKVKKRSIVWLANTENTRETMQGPLDFWPRQTTLVSTVNTRSRFFNSFHFAVLCSGEELKNSTLQLVQIFFDTASFDQIERDVEIKLENQISLIGGTMGLFTGFSIISGIEMIYFAIKIFFKSTMVKRKKKSTTTL